MAEILIHGMEMPKFYGDYDATFSVMPDGKITVVWECEFDPAIDELCGEVIPVPLHGRLIDADALIDEIANKYQANIVGEQKAIEMADVVLFDIPYAPTIIPASEVQENG